MRYFSPAKINLFFRVLSKRSDGFHEIATLMQAIDFFDVLTFSDHHSDRMTCSDPALLCDDSNLIMRAIKLFRKSYEFSSVHIHLEKRIPMQAGLGGGSSDAATVLFALNERIGRKASDSELCSMGAQLGSDVPFFFSSGSAYSTGRGEIVEPFLLPPISGYLAKPSFGLSTPRVFQETRVHELDPIDPLTACDRTNLRYFNDLESAALRIEPRLAHFKQSLISCGFSAVSMTGSGSAFFCIGNGDLRQAPEISLIPFHSVTREASSWYVPCCDTF
jgi:4-diphosphocytidyl-2-C-methyl-D-erythritol kinase